MHARATVWEYRVEPASGIFAARADFEQALAEVGDAGWRFLGPYLFGGLSFPDDVFLLFERPGSQVRACEYHLEATRGSADDFLERLVRLGKQGWLLSEGAGLGGLILIEGDSFEMYERCSDGPTSWAWHATEWTNPLPSLAELKRVVKADAKNGFRFRGSILAGNQPLSRKAFYLSVRDASSSEPLKPRFRTGNCARPRSAFLRRLRALGRKRFRASGEYAAGNKCLLLGLKEAKPKRWSYELVAASSDINPSQFNALLNSQGTAGQQFRGTFVFQPALATTEFLFESRDQTPALD